MRSPGGRENQPTGRYPGAGRDQDVLDVVDLVVGGSTHLPHTLGDAVHTVDVSLAEQPPVGVDRERSTERQPLDGGEVFSFAAPAESEFLELCEHKRREMVVDEGGLDVLWLEARIAPQPVCDDPPFGEPREVL